MGVEPTTHNLNDYCSTTELEKRSNPFYDYLFKRGWRDSNTHYRRDRPALVTNSTTPPFGARFLYNLAQGHLTTGNVAQKPIACRKLIWHRDSNPQDLHRSLMVCAPCYTTSYFFGSTITPELLQQSLDDCQNVPETYCSMFLRAHTWIRTKISGTPHRRSKAYWTIRTYLFEPLLGIEPRSQDYKSCVIAFIL